MAQVIQSKIRQDVIEGPKDYTGPIWKFYEPGLKPGPDTLPAPLDLSQLPWKNGMVVRAPNWLGDTVMSLPAVYRMRSALPAACGFFVVCPTALAPLWQTLPWVNEVIAFDGHRVRGPAAQRLQKLGAGVGVVLPNSFGSALDFFRKGIPVRLGRRGRFRGLLLTHTIPSVWSRVSTGERHQLSEYLELACLFNPPSWTVSYPGPELPDVAATVTRLGLTADGGADRWLVVAPGAAYGPAKQWPAGTFRQVAAAWQQRGGRVVAVGTAKEKAACAEAVDAVPGSVDLAGKTSLPELMAVLRNAACVVANDSGVMHLAAAVGAAGVALFGSTDPIATGPIGGKWLVLMEKLECSPCFLRQCRITGGDCLGLLQVSPAFVIEAMDYIVQRTRPV